MFPARHRRLGRAGPTVRVPRRLPVLLAVVGVVLLLGVVGGATWAAITPTATAEAVQGGFIIRSPEEAARLFSSVATFGFVMAVYGLVAALVAWFAARTWRGVIGYLAVLIATVAGSALAVEVGMRVIDWRRDDRGSVRIGDTAEVIPRLWLRGGTVDGPAQQWILLICAPFILTLIYLICVLASRTADLGVGDLDDAPAVADPAYAGATTGAPGAGGFAVGPHQDGSLPVPPGENPGDRPESPR